MQTLRIDIETKSSEDITNGVYKYVECPDFAVTLFAYRIDNQPTRCIDLANGEQIPEEVIDMLFNVWVRKLAFNAAFERTCLAKHFMQKMPPEQWECTQVKSIMLGLPMHLEGVGRVLGLSVQKDPRGHQLIKYFCIPRKPTKKDARTWITPKDDPKAWQEFKEYCIRDVDAEAAISDALSFFTPTAFERRMWILDQKINDRGVLIDIPFVKNAIRINTLYKAGLINEAIRLTNLDNPNSRDQLINWLNEELESTEGLMYTEVNNVTKKSVEKILKSCTNLVVTRVLKIRQQTSKTSIKKYDKMLQCICRDGRIRGIHQYYGAGRTGRWAGRGVQPQNLPKNFMKTLDLARQCVQNNDGELLQALYGNVPDVLSQLIRTAFIAPENRQFLPSDFAAIEARVIAWLSGEKWRLEVFATHGKIYEASAAQMFKIPIEAVTKTSDYRYKGKVSELALGYQGGPGALIRMGALEMGLTEPELKPLVIAWRAANPAIVLYWAVLDCAAKCAVESGTAVDIKKITFNHDGRSIYAVINNQARYVKPYAGEELNGYVYPSIVFRMRGSALFVDLPSGRNLVYINARLGQGKYGPVIQYNGLDQTSKQWGLMDTYGGKLVENVVQAIARDCLAFAMVNLDKEGYEIVLHVHDEAVPEIPLNSVNPVEHIDKIMGIVPEWAKGLPLKAESFTTPYYKKDD